MSRVANAPREGTEHYRASNCAQGDRARCHTHALVSSRYRPARRYGLVSCAEADRHPEGLFPCLGCEQVIHPSARDESVIAHTRTINSAGWHTGLLPGTHLLAACVAAPGRWHTRRTDLGQRQEGVRAGRKSVGECFASVSQVLSAQMRETVD